MSVSQFNEDLTVYADLTLFLSLYKNNQPDQLLASATLAINPERKIKTLLYITSFSDGADGKRHFRRL